MSAVPALTLVLGGARSGKSRFALGLGKQQQGKKYFIATAEALDDEMSSRIERHRLERGADWHTVEAPRKLSESIQSLNKSADLILIDCLTFWLSNLMMAKAATDKTITEEIDVLIESLAQLSCPLIAVSNEVGLGIVPGDKETRRFRDLAGFLHQRFAAAAGEVYFLFAGIPQRIKGVVNASH